MTNAFSASTLFGDLFSDTEIATLCDTGSFVKRMLEFELAWTNALESVGAVDAQAANQVRTAIESFDGAEFADGSARDGLPVPTLIATLKRGLPDTAHPALHRGATSQDVIDTAMVLVFRDVLDLCEVRAQQVLAQIDLLTTRFGPEPLMARTRMQAALHATVSLRLQSWKRPMVGHLEQLDRLRETLLQVQVGGPIGLRDEARTQAVAEAVADQLGLRCGPVWHTDRSAFLETGNWFSRVSGTLGKIGQDVALMAQQGVDEIALRGGGGSSAMAHKHNPIKAETLVALARFVAGQQGILAQSMVHEQERSGAAWALEWLTLPAMAEASGTALRHARDMLGAVERIGSPN